MCYAVHCTNVVIIVTHECQWRKGGSLDAHIIAVGLKSFGMIDTRSSLIKWSGEGRGCAERG